MSCECVRVPPILSLRLNPVSPPKLPAMHLAHVKYAQKFALKINLKKILSKKTPLPSLLLSLLFYPTDFQNFFLNNIDTLVQPVGRKQRSVEPGLPPPLLAKITQTTPLYPLSPHLPPLPLDPWEWKLVSVPKDCAPKLCMIFNQQNKRKQRVQVQVLQYLVLEPKVETRLLTSGKRKKKTT